MTMTQLDEQALEALRKMGADAEPGLWWVDDFKVDGGRGLYRCGLNEQVKDIVKDARER